MGTRVFVGNLNYDTTEDALQSLFSEDGRSVTDVHIVIDRDTGRSRGFGFVELDNDEEAREAIAALNGRELDGRVLNVNEARSRPGGGGGGGRGGGGGGGGYRSRDRW